uniref:NB-ARC domain-containing protein n=1 Tax=Oryza punctata TaxID=4537 RepID=A0A0E0JGM0_ORYPU
MEAELATIRAVLADAEARGGAGGDIAVRDWLRRLRPVAHDIDDFLDACHTDLHAARHRRRGSGRELGAVAASKDRFSLSPDAQPPSSQQLPSVPARRETISMVDESKTVGRSADKERLMRLVLDAAGDDEEDVVSVIPIVGIGGLGKTKLAQLAFNDRRANDEVFDPRIWVSMSAGFSLATLVQAVQPIVAAADERAERCDLTNLEAIARFLSMAFTGNKYLLVLDDVWSENHEEWERLKLLLRDGKRGSKIIVTTRSRRIGIMVGTVPPLMLKSLSDEDCWELFRRKAFEEGDEDLYPNLVRTGKEIVRKCGGVPLAAKALGSMLRFKRNEESWIGVRDKVEQHDLSKKGLEEDDSVKYKIHDLVHDLAQSVAGDEVQIISTKRVYGRTEACRYASLHDDMGSTEVLWSMLRKVRAFHSWGRSLDINLFLHSSFLVTLPSSIGTLQSLHLLNLKGCGNLEILPDIICSLQNLHFLNLSQCSVLQALPKNIGNLSNLLHLNLSQCTDLESIPTSIGRIKSLHILDLSHCSSLSELPGSIGGLHELQRLILSHHASSLVLPVSTSHLPNLQTLDLSWNLGLEELPESIGNLHSLKTLILFHCWSLHKLPESITNLMMLESLNLVGCENLVKLPDGMTSITNLKHLRNDQCRSLKRLPNGFGRWTKLETLSLLMIGDKHSSIAELKDLNNLTGELRIECWSHKMDLTTAAKRANWRNKKKLSKLTLSWTIPCSVDDFENVETFLEVLVPPENLEVLEIDGYMGTRFPSWMMKSMESWLPNLVSLDLSNIPNCSCLPPLGHIPYLQSLHLRYMAGVHSMSSEILVRRQKSVLYQSLKELHFEDMPNLETWPTSVATDDRDTQPEGSMFPVLKTVTATGCPKLRPKPCLPDAITDLSVSDSSEILSVKKMFGSLSSTSVSLLRRLWIRKSNVSSSEWKLLQHRPKLEELTIEYCETLCLPEFIRYLTALRKLKISDCTELDALPEWIGDLVALESLQISCCPKLISIPKSLQHLTALEELTVTACSSELNDNCREDTGKDWFKICHIPSIVIS